MKKTHLPAFMALAVTAVFAESIQFDKMKPGSSPGGWLTGVTGRGAHRWTIEPMADAPSKPHVLKQSAEGTYPWCVLQGVKLADGFVEVRFKPMAGQEDQAGGVVWRWQNGDSYYVARANALENNVALYYTEGGTRRKIKYVDAPVAPQSWHTLRVEFSGQLIRVYLDGRKYIEESDAHISAAGSVGLWTKADSVTAFDDFSYGK